MRGFVPKVGLLALGDPREEVPWREEEVKRAAALAGTLPSFSVDVRAAKGVSRSTVEVRAAVSELLEWDPDMVLLYVPIWTYPSLTVEAAELAVKEVPLIAVYGDVLSGLLASAGALGQVGIRRFVLWGSVEEVARRVATLARAAMAAKRLRGAVLALIGGRALGMYTVTADPSQVKALFGVDVEHVDQLELLRRAESVDEGLVERHFKWLVERVGRVLYDGRVLTQEKLRKQVRLYLAMKGLVAERGFSFCGLKCQPELSDGYVDACVAVALLNDPYDADGFREPVVCACETDVDGALTMQVLKLVSGGKPTTLMDLLVYDGERQLLYMGNCGGMATWFAEASSSPEENLKSVHLLPQVQGKAGGAATQYVAPELTLTLARLYRVAGRYHMVAALARSVRVVREELKRSIEPWPHIVVRARPEGVRRLVETVGANHLHAVAGDYLEELRVFCELKGIDFHEIEL
ncbi:MAG: hypothetical protein QXP94_05840 [Thermofilaceae archaeon]